MGELRRADRLITLLEPPRPAGLVSGGFRYQERVIEAIGAAARRQTVSPAELDARVSELRRRRPDEAVLVDGWFTELCAAPLPEGVIPLLHTVPRAQGWANRHARAVATSQRTAEQVRGADGAVAVVRPGVDACFTPRPRTGDGTFALVCAGAVCEAKGQRRLVEALRGVVLPWRLTLVGSRTAPAEELADVDRASEGLPVTVRDAVAPEELAALYAEHDLFVTLSRDESFGMAAAEAVAAGLPLVATDTGELATLGRDEARWLLPVDADERVVRAQLHDLIARPDELRALRGRSAAPVRTWRDAAAELVAALA